MLHHHVDLARVEEGAVHGTAERQGASAHVCQCFTTAEVESIMVPSISNRKPSNETVSGGAVYAILCRSYFFGRSILDSKRGIIMEKILFYIVTTILVEMYF